MRTDPQHPDSDQSSDSRPSDAALEREPSPDGARGEHSDGDDWITWGDEVLIVP